MNRRTVMTGVGTILAVSIAGCSALPGFGSDEAAVEEWIGELIYDGLDELRVHASRPSSINEVESVLESEEFEQEDLFGQSMADVDLTIDVTGTANGGFAGSFTVLVGDIDPNEALDSAEHGDELEQTADYGEYDVYEAQERDAVFGYNDESFIQASDRQWFESVVDTSAGDETPLSEADERFEGINSRLDNKDFLFIRLLDEPESNDDTVAFGVGMDYGDQETTGTMVLKGEDEDAIEAMEDDFTQDATVQMLGHHVEEDEIDELSVDGRFLTVHATIQTEQLWEDE